MLHAGHSMDEPHLRAKIRRYQNSEFTRLRKKLNFLVLIRTCHTEGGVFLWDLFIEILLPTWHCWRTRCLKGWASLHRCSFGHGGAGGEGCSCSVCNEPQPRCDNRPIFRNPSYFPSGMRNNIEGVTLAYHRNRYTGVEGGEWAQTILSPRLYWYFVTRMRHVTILLILFTQFFRALVKRQSHNSWLAGVFLKYTFGLKTPLNPC